ncbi:hypothetical protein EWM64_g2286 [Hericium alpestre]|uniref:Peptidase A1 domain-containing protein n=1 Tax=Hericium alpestre TaxID=135208 RepID=A0A4Z0A3X6_9AGAM|nr:hypothetical protein EWM64_g2286 [Hericium alpestre]
MDGFPIGIADTLTGQLPNSHGSGIAGFTNGKIDKPTRTGGVTLLEGLREFGLIPRSVVGIQLGRGTNGVPGTGQVTLGGADPTKYLTGAGNLVRMANQDSTRYGLWAVHVAKINVNGQDVKSDVTATLDTGSNRIMVANGDAALYHNYPEAVKTPNGIYGVPCDHTKIPPMTFQIGSVVFTLNPIDIVGLKIGNGGYCYSLIQDLPAGRMRQILGIPFLKSTYQILDSDANEITLAKNA